MTALFFSTCLSAEVFEGNGVIEEVDTIQNLITIGEERYRLPNSTFFEGSPAVMQLQPGYQVGFSGETGVPHSVITSMFIYPESIQQAQTGLER
tara:strand:- start:1379 stop:1660 length:282 start_codon:yes stop_codon:yes gene_type:complete